MTHVEADHGRVVQDARVVRLDEAHAAHVRLYPRRQLRLPLQSARSCCGERGAHREVEDPVHALARGLAVLS